MLIINLVKIPDPLFQEDKLLATSKSRCFKFFHTIILVTGFNHKEITVYYYILFLFLKYWIPTFVGMIVICHSRVNGNPEGLYLSA
jgi:hypothetical protein